MDRTRAKTSSGGRLSSPAADKYGPHDLDAPPAPTFVDEAGRDIGFVSRDHLTENDVRSLTGMYVTFDAQSRAHGLPPTSEASIRDWLDVLGEGYQTLAFHEDRHIGHAVLVGADDGSYELAIFVDPAHQHARIGTRLLDELLTYAADEGVETVTLFVERRNQVAINLYRRMGFEGKHVGTGELEMQLSLTDDSDVPASEWDTAA
ncbi:GNAT family N-acetyltransferase [Haloarchaeobius sp. DFWS5]|uniref:GNAT family N-acetyltransferase n=1 Tax=Haloarchaeobius sp. DFWS5 TaxID=3446114 RepID=UPI003EBC88DB